MSCHNNSGATPRIPHLLLGVQAAQYEEDVEVHRRGRGVDTRVHEVLQAEHFNLLQVRSFRSTPHSEVDLHSV